MIPLAGTWSGGLFVPPEQMEDFEREFATWRPYASIMAKAEISLVFKDDPETRKGFVAAMIDWGEILLRAPDDFDFLKAKRAVEKKLAEIRSHFEQHDRRLKDPEFQQKASLETRSQTEERHVELLTQLGLLEKQLSELEAAA